MFFDILIARLVPSCYEWFPGWIRFDERGNPNKMVCVLPCRLCVLPLSLASSVVTLALVCCTNNSPVFLSYTYIPQCYQLTGSITHCRPWGSQDGMQLCSPSLWIPCQGNIRGWRIREHGGTPTAGKQGPLGTCWYSVQGQPGIIPLIIWNIMIC